MNRLLLISGTCATLLLMVIAIGCGSAKNPNLCVVSGTVTLDDMPLSDAFVRFTPTTSGDSAAGTTKTDGTYTIQTASGTSDGGTTPGTYVVTFSKSEAYWDGKSYTDSYGENGELVKIKLEGAKELVPRIYTRPNSSPFTVTIEKSTKNVFDFDLKSNP